jgi:hypothetical protein
MWSAVLFLSLVVAMDPVRVGITALLLSRPRPVINLYDFWLGGITAGITGARSRSVTIGADAGACVLIVLEQVLRFGP